MGDSPASEAVYKIVGDRIRRRRIEKNMTQDDLAQELRLKRTSVTNIERGNQKILLHTLLSFAQVLELKPAELFDIDMSVTLTIPTDLPISARQWIETVVQSAAHES